MCGNSWNTANHGLCVIIAACSCLFRDLQARLGSKPAYCWGIHLSRTNDCMNMLAKGRANGPARRTGLPDGY